jgi:hypothetical protein
MRQIKTEKGEIKKAEMAGLYKSNHEWTPIQIHKHIRAIGVGGC